MKTNTASAPTYIDLADDIEETTPIDLGAWMPVESYSEDDITFNARRALEAV